MCLQTACMHLNRCQPRGGVDGRVAGAGASASSLAVTRTVRRRCLQHGPVETRASSSASLDGRGGATSSAAKSRARARRSSSRALRRARGARASACDGERRTASRPRPRRPRAGRGRRAHAGDLVGLVAHAVLRADAAPASKGEPWRDARARPPRDAARLSAARMSGVRRLSVARTSTSRRSPEQDGREPLPRPDGTQQSHILAVDIEPAREDDWTTSRRFASTARASRARPVEFGTCRFTDAARHVGTVLTQRVCSALLSSRRIQSATPRRVGWGPRALRRVARGGNRRAGPATAWLKHLARGGLVGSA